MQKIFRPILLGTLVVGTLDLLDALIFFGFRGVKPGVILQSIASGLLGSASYEGGTATALLGVACHYVIAFLIVATFVAASFRISALTRRPVLIGVIYGLAVYFVMNLVVVPLSAANSNWPQALPVVVNGLLIHMIGVGIPSAFAGRRAAAFGITDGVGSTQSS